MNFQALMEFAFDGCTTGRTRSSTQTLKIHLVLDFDEVQRLCTTGSPEFLTARNVISAGAQTQQMEIGFFRLLPDELAIAQPFPTQRRPRQHATRAGRD
jgi:hypothetical protein